jgi:NitT/TauT family transport system substrate-binding protein
MPLGSFHFVRNAALGAFAILLLAQGPALADDALSFLLGGTTPPLMNSLNLIADGAGFYKDEHLKVTTTVVQDTSAALKLCASGQADICPMGVEPAITQYGQGVHLKMFLTRASKFGYVIVVLDGSPIKTLADFKGKSIGVHALNVGSSASLATQSSLAAAGVTPADYSLVAIGMTDSAATALTSGRVDAAALPLYELIPYLVGGMKLRIFHHSTLENSANAGYLAAPSVLASKHDAIQRFSRAIVKASLLIHDHPDAAGRALLTALHQPFTAADVQRKTAEFTVWQNDLPASDPDSRRIATPSMTGMQAYIQLLKNAGAITTPVQASDVVTDEFSAFANDFDHKAIENFAK